MLVARAILHPIRSAAVTSPAAPISSNRVAGIDIARGLAMLGMIAVHVQIGTNESAGKWGDLLFHSPSGRSAVVFFTLSGVALSIISNSGSRSAETQALLRRGFVLLFGGMLVLLTIWSASILHQYGAMFLAAPFLLKRSNRWLVAATAICLTLGAAVFAYGAEIDGIVGEQYVVVRSAYQTLHSALFGMYPLVVWSGFFMTGIVIGRANLGSKRLATGMFLGGAICCVGLTLAVDAINRHYDQAELTPALQAEKEASAQGETTTTTAATSGECELLGGLNASGEGSAAGKTTTTPDATTPDSTAPETQSGSTGANSDQSLNDCLDAQLGTGMTRDRFLSLAPHAGSTAWALQSLSLAIAIIGLCLLLPASLVRILKPVQYLGAMSLSAYIIHMILVQDLWTILGNTNDTVGLWHQIFSLLAIFAIELIIATLVMRKFKKGPFEWVLAQVTAGPARSQRSVS
jgi:uncharacterized membrane protein YeiB